MSRLRLIIFAETKAHYLVSGKRNIPPLSWRKDSQLYLDVPYAPLLTLPLDWQRWGWSFLFQGYLRITYIRVIDTHTYMYIYARVENARVFITARYRPNIIFAARASTATSLVLCLSALVALTRATLTSPRTLTYLLTYLLHQRNLFRSREISGLTFLWFFARIIAESGHRANFRSEEREREDFKHERTRSEKKGDARIELVEGSVRWLNGRMIVCCYPFAEPSGMLYNEWHHDFVHRR